MLDPRGSLLTRSLFVLLLLLLFFASIRAVCATPSRESIILSVLFILDDEILTRPAARAAGYLRHAEESCTTAGRPK